MSLKAYVAGRISRQEEVRSIIAILKIHGFEITRDWTWTKEIRNEQEAAQYRKKAYSERKEIYAKEAEDDIQASLNANIFIILSDELGSSMYAEFGAALAGFTLVNKPQKIYAIGPHVNRMLHYQHPAIIWVSSINEVISHLKNNKII